MTNCSVKYSRRIHIIPMFSKETNNTTKMSLPPEKMEADTVYLITTRINPMPRNAETLKSQLEEKRTEIKKIAGAFDDDLYYAIGVLRKIIESERGNQIFINMPSSSQIWTSAGLIAAMLFSDKDDNTEIIPYYLKQKYPKSGKYDINTLPIEFRIEKPSDDLLNILSKISEIEKIGITVTKKRLIEVLEKSNIKLTTIADNDSTNVPGKYNALQRKYIKPLTDWGYITASGSGYRSGYSVTEQGMNALHAFVE